MTIDFKKIKRIYKSIDIYDIANDCKVSIFDTPPPLHIIDTFEKCTFCWDSFREFAKKCNKFIVIEILKYKFNFYYQNNLNIPMYRIYTTIKNVLIIAQLFNINKPFHFHIMLNEEIKQLQLDSQNEIITSKNINGGITNILYNDIFIIRKEEFPKTIIHELLHHSIIHNSFSRDDIEMLKSNFNISEKMHLECNEAIIELYATILYNMILSCETGIEWRKLLNIEKKYSIKQANKILEKQRKRGGIWYEETNSYCYIVFKTILLLNYDKFINTIAIPYNSKNVTQFLIDHREIPKITKKILKEDNSLRMMILSN